MNVSWGKLLSGGWATNHMRFGYIGLLLGIFSLMAFASTARADIFISIDKSKQMLAVTVDGHQRYLWPVSTGAPGYDTPDGEFQPFRMERDHFSREWDDAPMPYSMFFTKIGHAIHGTYETKRLGRPVSHGCVRLSIANAATLFAMVEHEGVRHTHVALTGEIPGGDRPLVTRRSDDPFFKVGLAGLHRPDKLRAPREYRAGDPRIGSHSPWRDRAGPPWPPLFDW